MEMHKKIRVAHIITNFAAGGAQEYLLSIVKGLDKSLFEPMVLGRMEGEFVQMFQSLEGVKVLDVRSLRRDISPFNDVRSVFEITRLCKENQIDIVHTHSSKAGVVGRLGAWRAGVKTIVHTVHGFSFNDFMPGLERAGMVFLERWMSRYTTDLLFVSNKDRETGNALGIGAKERSLTIYNGIDYQPFESKPDREAVRKSLGIDSDDYVIGFTGRLSKQKGIHILVEAFARFQSENLSARLLLVGDGPLRNRVENLARKLRVESRVSITGFRDDVAQMLSAMDLFVMTSLWEGLSRSLVEAMYAKIPVIATDVGGTSDAVKTGETGWLVPPDDIDSVASAMKEAVADPQKCARLAGSAHAWAVSAFDLRKMLLSISSMYLEAAGTLSGEDSRPACHSSGVD